MSVDRLAALELRLAGLERRRRSSLVFASAGVVALALASQMGGAHAQATPAVRAPFRVVNATGQDIFTVTQAGSETRVSIVNRDNVTSMWSASEDVAALSLGGTKAQGIVRLGMNFGGAGTGPSLLMADDGRDLLSVDKDSVEVGAALSVIPKDTPTLRVESDLVTVTNAMTVKALKGGNRTSLGPTKLSIHGGDGVSEAASLGLDEAQRGILRVGTPGGLRAAIGFSKPGTGISLGFFNKPGPDDLVSLYAGATGSVLELHSAKFHTSLFAYDTGSAVSLSDGKDSALVKLATENGSGNISVSNATGQVAVEVRANSNGIGIVQAGPNFGAAIAMIGKK